MQILPTVIDYEYKEKLIERDVPYENYIERIISEPV